MIKGVNKQIIEIRCPKDEQFEKILLFVNGQNGRLTDSEADEKAKLIAKRFLDAGGVRRGGRFRAMLRKNRVIAAVCAAVLAAVIVCAFVVLI